MFTFQFQRRDFLAPELTPGIEWTVEEMEWRAVGGPWTARLAGRADSVPHLVEAGGLLRCGVTVSDDNGPAWWGYVNAVEIGNAAHAMRFSLDEMANRVSVSYRARTPTDSGGTRFNTAFEIAEGCAEVYGEKERIFSMGQASAAEAQAYAKALLLRDGEPAVRYRMKSMVDTITPPENGFVWIEARGWWETLDWKLAEEPRGQTGLVTPGKPQKLGDAAGSTKIAQSFQAGTAEGWDLAEVWVRVSRAGALDQLKLEVCADSGATTPGAVLASASIAAGSLADEQTWTRFSLPAKVSLAVNTPYWLVLSRSGALNAAAFFQAAVDEYQGYGQGGLRLWNGSAWVLRAPNADLCFQAVGVEETTTQLRRLLEGGPGQFLRKARIEQPSGIDARMYRDLMTGEPAQLRGRAVAERLLGFGSAAGGAPVKRLLARVEPDRLVRVYAQAGPESAALRIGAGGEITTQDGRRLHPSEWPAGRWAKSGAFSSPGPLPNLALRQPAPDNAVFFESCAWKPTIGFFIESVESKDEINHG